MEHERVAQCVNQLYSVPEYIFMLQREIIKKHWIQNRPSFTEERLDRCYSIEEIKKSRKNRKPNILMVGYAFAAGGGETFPIQLANLLKGCGYGVTFLNCDQEERNEDIRKMLRNDIPIVNNYYFLEKITVEFDIDIIHSHHAWADNAILDILPENTQCRTIVTIHGMYEMMEGGELKKILPRLLKRTDKIVYTADKNLKPFINYRHFNKHRHKFIKIDNALPIEDIEPINLNALNIPSDAFVLCLVSRAIPEKGWKEAVESVKRARELSGRNIHLLLIGEGEEHNYFKLLNLPSYLHLLGFRNNIRAYYAASHMGFLPSRFEGESCPLTLIDCLLAGKPVIASNIGEIPRMLESAGTISGVLFPLDSNGEIPVPQVADIIAQCATNEVYYENMKKAVPAAAAKFKPEVMRNKYEQVYMEVMGRSKTKSRKLNSDE
jgi:glycosyltransferase involved in cell wall biosynthesis